MKRFYDKDMDSMTEFSKSMEALSGITINITETQPNTSDNKYPQLGERALKLVGQITKPIIDVLDSRIVSQQSIENQLSIDEIKAVASSSDGLIIYPFDN